MNAETDTLILILAGGQSRRMGRDKASLPFGEATMLTALVRRFRETAHPTAVSVRTAGQFDTAGADEIVDLYPGQGPLAGLHAAFSATEAERIFLTGTDLPFLTVGLAEAMLALAAESAETDCCVVQRADGKAEPLCGVYRRSCLPQLERCLREGRRSFKALFRGLRVRYVQEEELPGFDLAHQLDNLNTPEDYRRAVGADGQKLPGA